MNFYHNSLEMIIRATAETMAPVRREIAPQILLKLSTFPFNPSIHRALETEKVEIVNNSTNVAVLKISYCMSRPLFNIKNVNNLLN